jgi:hypothetical protein
MATFHREVRTAKWVEGGQYGTFARGYQENVQEIPMPSTAELSDLEAQAASGGVAFGGDSNGAVGEATTRIEFVALDLNGDGDRTDPDEGFFRVTTTDMLSSENRGWWDAGGAFRVAAEETPGDAQAGLESATHRPDWNRPCVGATWADPIR